MSENNLQSRKKMGRWFYVIGTLVFLVYAVWIMGPYFRSIIVRDAAVTSWINIATAPITGTITSTEQFVAGTVGANGIIAVISNSHLNRNDFIAALTRYENAVARQLELQENYEKLSDLEENQNILFLQYADTFRELLANQLENISREIESNAIALKRARDIAFEREQSTVTKKKAPQPERDATRQTVWKFEARTASLLSEKENIKLRIEAANNGVFFTADGNEPAWANIRNLDIQIRKYEIAGKLQQAQADAAASKLAMEMAEENFSRMAHGIVEAPAGSIVWRKTAAPGATVLEGERLADWLDCSILMIDVPVDDAEVSLIKAGMEAEILLEGDITTRKAEVLLTRGSAFTLDNNDLAAIAKGRGDGTAQVLLDFSHERENFDECPVGRAAYVDFPDVGILDIIRARLRF
ncbi:hypothetical protein NBZ79_03600 [Sneathiella marina]|uniref:HlyD family secretion protein n=1 Tax=Sneathiella marina TaxID=2950108 RepID=A0ABY4W805_9PROT|nr:hypothetical protein [Sneathiella marina]USG62057.1 hypothetical protein NBZ79_03600 [Sneathiella marina]